MSTPSDPGTRPEAAFEERQRFREAWVLALIAILAVGAWGALAWSLVVDDSEVQPFAVVVVAMVFGVGFPWFLYSLELHTVVDRAGVWVHFRHGIGTKRFEVTDMVSVSSVKYRPLRDFGGWGLRWGWGNSRAYNVSGDRGVEIVVSDGRRWVIGSQRPDELAAAVEALGVPAAPGRPETQK